VPLSVETLVALFLFALAWIAAVIAVLRLGVPSRVATSRARIVAKG